MNKVYLYPRSKGTRENPGNQYMNCFAEAYRKDSEYEVLDRRVTKNEIFDFLFNSSANLYIISWIESIVFTLSGKLQFLFFVVLMRTFQCFGRKVVWVYHNKHPHKGDSRFSRLAMKTMARISDKVITHSTEGVKTFNDLYSQYQDKCVYLPHPVYTTAVYESSDYKWDYIIWGEINRRKGIAEFLEFISGRPYYQEKKILVCGLCKDKEYAKQIEKYCNTNINFVNRFVKDDELKLFILASKAVLFTYSSNSVLSSGALIYSLNFCKPVIGPRVGNFVDLQGVVSCYDNFADIEHIKIDFNHAKCIQYIEENQWEYVPQKIEQIIGEWKQ